MNEKLLPSPDDLAEGPSIAPIPPALDDIMADDLNPRDIVFFNDEAHQFLAKVPGGPHVFWHGGDSKEVRYTTAEIFQLRA
jgi:hypothetical protein